MCLSKNILYQYFVLFVLLGTASPLKTFYMSLYSIKRKVKATTCYLETNELLLDADGHELA